MRSKIQVVALLVCTALVCGCGGGGGIRVAGKVTFDDGTLATKGTVVFRAAGFQDESEIGSDGRYALETGSVPEGTYDVFFRGFNVSDDDGKMIEQLIDQKYESPGEMTLEVKNGKKNYDLTLPKWK